MARPYSPGPQVKRITTAAGGVIYDASRARHFDESWFEPSYWRDKGAIVGEAAGRGTTLFIRSGSLQMALRHYRRGGLMSSNSSDLYFFNGDARTRPIQEWSLNDQLRQLGLPVPAPIAARYVRHGLMYRADLITERVDGAESLDFQLRAGPVPISRWIAIGRCIRRFHDAGLCHADLNARNILRRIDGAVFVIDLDRGRFRRPGMWRDANLVRLRRSLIKIDDTLPERRFTETDWHSLLAGYWEAAAPADIAA